MKTIKTSINSLIPLIEESFQNNQEINIVVKGTSMFPTFIDNETVVSLKKFSGTLQKNHIYLYNISKTFLLHRYLKSKNKIHIFRGDNCSNYEYVDIKSIIGEVTMIDQHHFRTPFKTKCYLRIKRIKSFIKKCIRG